MADGRDGSLFVFVTAVGVVISLVATGFSYYSWREAQAATEVAREANEIARDAIPEVLPVQKLVSGEARRPNSKTVVLVDMEFEVRSRGQDPANGCDPVVRVRDQVGRVLPNRRGGSSLHSRDMSLFFPTKDPDTGRVPRWELPTGELDRFVEHYLEVWFECDTQDARTPHSIYLISHRAPIALVAIYDTCDGDTLDVEKLPAVATGFPMACPVTS